MEWFEILQGVIFLAVAIWGGWYAHRQKKQRHQ